MVCYVTFNDTYHHHRDTGRQIVKPLLNCYCILFFCFCSIVLLYCILNSKCMFRTVLSGFFSNFYINNWFSECCSLRAKGLTKVISLACLHKPNKADSDCGAGWRWTDTQTTEPGPTAPVLFPLYSFSSFGENTVTDGRYSEI